MKCGRNGETRSLTGKLDEFRVLRIGDRLQCDLQSECEELECRLRVAGDEAKEVAGHGFAQLHSLAASLDVLGYRIQQLRLKGVSKADVAVELNALAAEAGRLGEVRAYVEAALHLERLVGDLEDDVFAAASTTVISKSKFQAQPSSRLSTAARTLRVIETTLAELTASRPQWGRITTAVDIRVDRAIAAIRPVAVADFRSVMVSIGWPPELSTSKQGASLKRQPLQLQKDEVHRLEQSFVSLSTLQAVQLQRNERTRIYASTSGREVLWAIDEMVTPISDKCNVHFNSWLETPEFVFVLAKKIAEEHITSVDSTLQPMLDEASLAYSAREEWVLAIVNMVAEHLRKFAIPTLVKDMEDEAEQVSTLWLHTVDETLSFDGKMQALAGITAGATINGGFAVPVLGLHRPCISVFADRADWFQLWLKFEKDVALRKLKLEFDSEAAWKNSSDGEALIKGNFRPPVGAQVALSLLESAVERCRILPEAAQRFEFIKGAGFPILDVFLDELWQRCHEAEALKAMADDESMRKVAVCINAAHYCECTLREWCEDMFFLELKFADQNKNFSNVISEDELKGSVLDGELSKIEQFRSTWLGKLSSVISRGFEARSSDYFRNKKRWSEEAHPNAVVMNLSGSLVLPFGVLQNQLETLKNTLEQANFVETWQKLIPSLDQLVFQGVVTSGARFSEQGAQQFSLDVKSLLAIFRSYCPRPASLFLALSDAVKLLSLPQDEALDLLDKLSVFQDDEEQDDDLEQIMSKLLKQVGIRKLRPEIAAKVLGLRNQSRS